MGNSVFNAYSVLRTRRGAVAKSETAVGAASLAAVHKLCGGTGLHAVIVNLVLGVAAVACAVYDRDLLNNVLKLNAEHLAELTRNAVRSGDTEVCRCVGVFAQSLCVAVAAGKAARSAVSSRKTFPDGRKTLVLLDRHYF